LYYLKVNSHFDAAHFLRNYQGKCANIHGHTWQVQIMVKGVSLNNQGILIDFGILKTLLNETIAKFDHQLINDLPEFSVSKLNPTAENIAGFVFENLVGKLPQNIQLDCVEVWESPKSSAIFRKEST
jgi:6-pyruvoyltetrahydropterin/6-carboxytetrahydropterin synthase